MGFRTNKLMILKVDSDNDQISQSPRPHGRGLLREEQGQLVD